MKSDNTCKIFGTHQGDQRDSQPAFLITYDPQKRMNTKENDMALTVLKRQPHGDDDPIPPC